MAFAQSVISETFVLHLWLLGCLFEGDKTQGAQFSFRTDYIHIPAIKAE